MLNKAQIWMQTLEMILDVDEVFKPQIKNSLRRTFKTGRKF